jgi:ribonuclease HI
MTQLTLYTDGSGTRRGNPGGWAYILRNDSSGLTHEESGGLNDASNNSAELTAVVKGLRYLRDATTCSVKVVSDSTYVCNGINMNLSLWAARGFRRHAPNLSLWKSIWFYMRIHKVTAQWVRGHNGHIENTRCDQLANAARIAMITRSKLTTNERIEL